MSDHFNVPVERIDARGTLTEPVYEGFSTTLFADAAVDFLEDYAASDRSSPFLAYVSFTVPHDPRTPPKRYLETYQADDIPLPPNYLPEHPFDTGRLAVRDEILAPWPRSPAVIRAQIAEYYGLITHMDDEIGRILEVLHSRGLAEDTIILFTSDHGLAMGRHGLLGKQNLYEHSAKTPLVTWGTGIPRGESDALVYLHDLFPTVLRLAGMEPPGDADGMDLSVLWSGRQTDLRERIFLAYEDLHRAVIEDRWKLIRYPRIHHTQLFDLQADPHEMHNLAEDPSHREHRTRMMALLESWQESAGDPHPLTAEEKLPMQVDYSSIARTPDRHQPESVVRKYFGD